VLFCTNINPAFDKSGIGSRICHKPSSHAARNGVYTANPKELPDSIRRCKHLSSYLQSGTACFSQYVPGRQKRNDPLVQAYSDSAIGDNQISDIETGSYTTIGNVVSRSSLMVSDSAWMS